MHALGNIYNSPEESSSLPLEKVKANELSRDRRGKQRCNIPKCIPGESLLAYPPSRTFLEPRLARACA